MSITVMRKVAFCAGHRLLNHEGKCANLHGHNYLVEFHITGNEVDDLGRVVDFADIKRCLLYTSPSPRDKRQSRMPSSA